jgi:2'-5' RNA ligase
LFQTLNLKEVSMPDVIVYLDVEEPLAKQHREFSERYAREVGVRIPVLKLPPHITVIRQRDYPERDCALLSTYLIGSLRRNRIQTFVASVLPAAEFPIEGKQETVLHLPLENWQLRSHIAPLHRFFCEELGWDPPVYEGKSPHITLIDNLPAQNRDSALVAAGIIDWLPVTAFRSLSIATKSGAGWETMNKFQF